MRDLRIHIERIVRPIAASPRRKMRMREEMLGHLSALAEETGSIDRALERFGDPAEIRKGLQASVPRGERLAHMNLFPSPFQRRCQRWIQRSPQESDLRHALRIAAVFTALGLIPTAVILFGLVPLTVALTSGHVSVHETFAAFWKFATPSALFMSVAIFACVLFGHVVVRHMEERSNAPTVQRLIVRGILLAAFMIALGFLFTWLMALLGQGTWTIADLLIIGGIAGAAPLVGTFVGCQAHEEKCRRWEWKSLDIGD